MKPPRAEELHTILSHGRWDQAVAILNRLDPRVAADVFLSLTYEEQQVLFRRLPVEFDAKLAPIFPYYDTFVLLHTLSTDEMSAVVEKMNFIERSNFLEELPEGARQQIVKELSGKQSAESRTRAGGSIAIEEAEIDRFVTPVQPIIEARQIEKGFNRPGGGRIQVIAPTSLSVEPGAIVALLGPSGSGKSTLLRMLSGLTAPSAGEVLWHGKPLGGSSANAAIVFQSFALFPWLTVPENVEVPLLARGMKHVERHRRALRTLHTLGRSPAKIRADFRVPLQQPRERNSAEFLLYMDYIYKLMMQPHLEAQPPFCGHEVKSAYGMLPRARRGAIAGLLEPLEFFRDILQEHFPDDEVQRQIDTALNWGRYGDIFTYDSESDRLLLNQATRHVERPTAVPLH